MCLKIGLELSTSHDEGENNLLHFAIFRLCSSENIANEVDRVLLSFPFGHEYCTKRVIRDRQVDKQCFPP